MKDNNEQKEKTNYGRKRKNIPTKKVERQCRCALVEERGGEGGIGNTRKLVAVEVVFWWGFGAL